LLQVSCFGYWGNLFYPARQLNWNLQHDLKLRQAIKKTFSTAFRLAGIDNLHWHDLRHTFGTRLAEAGCSAATIADLMGHT
jgi:integrase